MSQGGEIDPTTGQPRHYRGRVAPEDVDTVPVCNECGKINPRTRCEHTVCLECGATNMGEVAASDSQDDKENA